MPAYNAERFLLQSVQSVLSQTYREFELIVVDDASTDKTSSILDGIADRRVRAIRNPVNLGIVGSLNRAMSESKGRFIARLDSDDYCLPTRLAKQLEFLNANPAAALVGTEMSVLNNGKIEFSRMRTDLDPLVLRWMLHISNPIGHPSMMFRSDSVQRLGSYLDESKKYAEDFDFTHRILHTGHVHVLPRYLTIYRRHGSNATTVHRREMIDRTSDVLQRVFDGLIGVGGPDYADLIARHMFAGVPVQRRELWLRLRAILRDLFEAFCIRYLPGDSQRSAMELHTTELWARVIQRTLWSGHVAGVASGAATIQIGSHEVRTADVAKRTIKDVGSAVRSKIRKAHAKAIELAQPGINEVVLQHQIYKIERDNRDQPPRLYAVVDTEAEFDWNRPFSRCETQVTSMRQQTATQSLFDDYGVRPIYVVDYAVATQAEGYEPLLGILKREGCAVGAHLHPWINPPFEEELSIPNSFAGNLPADLEERKLSMLKDAIVKNLGKVPLFYKAGRYGLGPNTVAILARLGFQVDFSILPFADLRSSGGPDFRAARAQPYRTAEGGLISLPMTRGHLGIASLLLPELHRQIYSRPGRVLRLPGISSRIGLFNTVTLSPEGMTVVEQCSLINALISRGHRTFVLHYHSSTLGGHTPYVRTSSDLAAFIRNIRDVCHFFFTVLGGLPGNPADLVHPDSREMVFSPIKDRLL